jgi:phosphohistidine phosphatase
VTRAPRTIYLVRHGIAAERGPAWPDDVKRPLTPRGIDRMRQVVRGLRQLGVHIDVVVTSPLVRARQTADLLIDGLKPVPDLAVATVLSPGVAPAKMAETLLGSRKRQVIALVGHEPGLGELAAWLLGAKAPLPFKKGGVCCIELRAPSANGSGQLVWMATPRMLRGIR